MHDSTDISDFLPRRQHRYRVPMAGSCLALVMLMFWSTDNAVFRTVAIILAVGIFAAYWYEISWPAVTAVVCAVGLGLYSPYFQIEPNHPSSRKQCENHLRQVVLALAAYHSAHGQYPPPHTTDLEGEPLLSWRVLILPYLERRDLYEQFHLDEPWDSPHNLPLARHMPESFRCSTARASELTSYLAVVGDDTVWQAGEGVLHQRVGGIGMLVEDPFSAVVWTQPVDLSLEHGYWRVHRLLRIGTADGHHGGVHIATTTGKVLLLSRHSLTEEAFRELFTNTP